MNRRERKAIAKNSGTSPKSPAARTPAALYQAGLRHLGAGRHLDAQLCCRQALAIEPEHADALHLMGLLSLHTHQYDHAVALLARAIVITVCTSAAHLAATLGCPTWVLLPYVPDWRWLLDRDDSPWYPAVRLFRQQEARDYDSVIDRVHAELMVTISTFEPVE
jgi:tetratricopeptide (TPR) repeat protein